MSAVAATPLSVFLCHASGDKAQVRGLAGRLRGEGFAPWLDEEDLLPGQDWEREIRRAVRAAGVVLVCLSNRSIPKQGFVQKEIRIALDVADEQPEDTIYIIPARLEVCEVPERLRPLQRVDLFAEDGYRRLLRALQLRATALGSAQPPAGGAPASGGVSATTGDGGIWGAIDAYGAAATYHEQGLGPLPNLRIKNETGCRPFGSPAR